MCDCKRRRTIWLTIDKTCAFGSQVMISSQGTKSSFHSQCKFETGMVKKRAATQSLKLSECPFFDMGFSRFMRLGSGLKRPLGSLGFLSMLSFFLLRRYPKAFSQIVCLSRKIFNFLFFGFSSEVLHFTPLINPSWVGTEKLRNRTVCVQGAKTTVCYESWWFTLATTLCHSLWNLSSYFALLLQKQL